jgi:AraC-like DNA-binding protein
VDDGPVTKPQTKMDKIPTSKEIEDAEARLNELKAKRTQAMQVVLASLRSKEVIDSLNPDEAISIMRVLQSKFAGARRRVRGSPVPKELKLQLTKALMDGEYTLSQLARMFNLSISYISRIKHELGLTGVKNAYHDRQIHHQLHRQPDQQQGAA